MNAYRCSRPQCRRRAYSASPLDLLAHAFCICGGALEPLPARSPEDRRVGEILYPANERRRHVEAAPIAPPAGEGR
jgi:hypothetical protein